MLLANIRTGTEFFVQMVEAGVPFGTPPYRSAPIGGEMVSLIDDLEVQLDLLGLRMSAKSLSVVKGFLTSETQDLKGVVNALAILQGRFKDELDTVLFLSLNSAEQELFDPPTPPWGAKVAANFPSLTDEISEAAKCLAVGRYTASAFHTLRSLEAGILAIARSMGLPDPIRGRDRNWGVMLKSIKDAIDTKWNAAGKMSGDGQTFDELYAALAGMQNPWRNATMHLENSFTKEQAQHVFDVARGFMQRVADRMDENGAPKI